PCRFYWPGAYSWTCRHCERQRRFHGEWIAAKSDARLRLLKTTHWRQSMLHDHPSVRPTAILTQFGAIFVSLELSRSKWVLTSLSPGNGEKMSQYSLTAGDIGGVLARGAGLPRKAKERTGLDYPIITI